MKFFSQTTLFFFVFAIKLLVESSTTTSAPKLNNRGLPLRSVVSNIYKSGSFEEDTKTDEDHEKGINLKLSHPEDPLKPLDKPTRQPVPERELQCSDELLKMVEEYEKTKTFHINGLDKLKQIEDVYNNLKHQRKTYYTYLLLRGSVIEQVEDISKITFRQFLSAIFYAGKGVADRVLQHLKEAGNSKNDDEIDLDPVQSHYKTSPPFSTTKTPDELAKFKKVTIINNEWANGNGVYLYKFVDLIHEGEALVREAFVIKCYGRDFLTNKQQGHGTRSELPEFKKWLEDDEISTQIGSHILFQAYQAFKYQRLRPFYRADVGELVF